MPVETIKCRECGSADVTEFKPGSYVCAHCEAIFKHVDPAAASGGCEIDGCGVPAIGRCSSCKRRFCGTHQARDMGPERPVISASGLKVAHRDTKAIYVDQCAPCRRDQLAREAREKMAAENAADSKQHAILAGWDANAAEALRAVSDPMERLVRAISELGRAPFPFTPEVRRLMRPFPSDRELAAWFLRVVDRKPGGKVWVPYSGWRGGARMRQRPGWVFLGGSQKVKTSPYGAEGHGNIYIVHEDGRVLYGENERTVGPVPGDGFNAKAVKDMAMYARLEPFGLPARPEIF